MQKYIGWWSIIEFLGVSAAAEAQNSSPPTVSARFDGTYAWVSATKVNETYAMIGTNRIGRCGDVRDLGPLIIANGQTQYYLHNTDQSLSEGTVAPEGELTMRLVATPARRASWDPPAIITNGRIDGNGAVRARRMTGYCDNELIWRKTPSPLTSNTQFDGTYAFVSVTQVNEDNSGSGTNQVAQCGNRQPKSLIVTNGQARLPVFEGTVGSQGHLAMREGPSGYERIINGRIDGNGTVRAREIGRGCTYDFVWQKVTNNRSRERRQRKTRVVISSFRVAGDHDITTAESCATKRVSPRSARRPRGNIGERIQAQAISACPSRNR